MSTTPAGPGRKHTRTCAILHLLLTAVRIPAVAETRYRETCLSAPVRHPCHPWSSSCRSAPIGYNPVENANAHAEITMPPEPESLILLPQVDSKTNYLDGFWHLVDMLAQDNYERAFSALLWPSATPWSPATLKKRITTFFGGAEAWSVVIPNERLIGVINDAAQFAPRNADGWGWFMAQIPLTTEPEEAKRDDLPLMGLAASFFVRPHQTSYALELEIFHL